MAIGPISAITVAEPVGMVQDVINPRTCLQAIRKKVTSLTSAFTSLPNQLTENSSETISLALNL